MTDIERFNQKIAGTGFQFYPKATKVRVENEAGDFIRYAASMRAAIKKHIPNGCGRMSQKSLIEEAQQKV